MPASEDSPMLTAEENDPLCLVEGDAPMGQIFRRHRLPACLGIGERWADKLKPAKPRNEEIRRFANAVRCS
jgi:hypothetical protein